MGLEGLIALLLLPGQTPPPSSDQLAREQRQEINRKAARDKVQAWLKGPHAATNWHCTPEEYAARLLKLIDEPNLLSQGQYPWCMYAAALYFVLVRNADTAIQYALAYYDQTADAKLGGFGAKLNSNLKAFDVKSSHADTERTDWILLAGLCAGRTAEVNRVFTDFDGPVDDAKDGAGDPETLRRILDKCFEYASVVKSELTSSTAAAEARTLLTPSWNCDVILIAPFSQYFLGGATLGAGVAPVVSNRHAAPIISLVGDKLTFWSWGKEATVSAKKLEQNPSITVLPENGYCEMGLNVAFLTGSTLSGSRFVIRAQLR